MEREAAGEFLQALAKERAAAMQALGDEVAVRCLNPACPAQLKGRLRHFVQRDAMDIEGLGTMWIDAFVEKGLIKDLADIYYLDRKEIEGLERMGEKSTENLFAAIEESKNRPLERLIYGLGIIDVGERSSHLIAQKFKHLEKFLVLKTVKCSALDMRLNTIIFHQHN